MKKSITKSNKKISLSEFIWNGFNTIFGIAFLNYFVTIIVGSDGGQPLGLNVIWIFLLASCVAYVCVFAFKKLSERFGDDKNGGAMIYAYGIKGKLFGCFVGYSQLLIIPLSVCVWMDMIIKNIFSPDIVAANQSIPFIVQDWGAFTNLYLDLIGIVVFSGIMLLNIVGIKYFKKISKWSGIVKWGAGGLFILLALVLMFMNAKTNLPNWKNNSHLNIINFIQAFNVAFFSLSGFETILTSGKNVDNPKKNLGKGINISMILSICISMVFLLMMFSAFSSFSGNQDISAWTAVFGTKVYAIIGISFSCVAVFFQNGNHAIQIGLYGGTSLQPLSEVGFFSKKASRLNKDDVPVRAIIYMVCICIAVAIVLLVIPETVEGIKLSGTLPGDRNGDIRAIAAYHASFSISSLAQTTAIFAVITYSSVLFCALWCVFKEKSIKSNLFLNTCFIICLISLLYLIVGHFGLEIYSCAFHDSDFLSHLIKLLAEVIVVVGTYGFFAINYHVRRKSILNKY